MARLIHKRSPRHGVLLLLVLALLAMFGLLAISFVVITGQAKRTAQAISRTEESADPRLASSGHSPDKLLNDAIAQVIRGTNNGVSVMGGHDLLDDIYGNAPQTGTFTAVSLVANGQMLDLTSTVNASAYIGSVLTVTTPGSPAYAVSFRIVGYNPSSTTIRILNDAKLPVYGSDGQPGRAGFNDNGNMIVDEPAEFGSANTDDLVRVNDQFLINGVPFSGTGFGHNTSGSFPRNDGAADGRPLVLQPNHSSNRTVTDDVNEGQPNEDYDAPDYQNLLLALMVLDSTGQVRVPIPSLHRPELVNYWMNPAIGNPWNTDIALRRRVLLRPFGRLWSGDTSGFTPDHPNFTGSNPDFNPAWDGVTAGAGQWDVDNDSDGIPDSIWVDLGAAVRKARDGRAYKPLFAILCLDMDGRMNVNAHGSTEQLASTYSQQVNGDFAGSASASDLTLPRGEGYGAADINLATGLTSLGLSAADVAKLLQGDSSSTPAVEGRYGELGGSVTSPQAGVTGSANTLSSIKLFEYPENYTDVLNGANLDTTKLTAFGNPPDLWGRGAFALDYRGQPYYSRSAWNNEVTNNPYRLNLSRNAPRLALRSGSTVDNPFTPGELERVLRAYDVDAGILAQRLTLLAPDLVTLRTQITTDSYDVPIPGRPAASNATVIALLRAKLTSGGASNVDAEIAKMLSWELLSNRRLDINRPLGNGGNPGEPGEPEAAWNGLFPGVSGNVNFELTNGVVTSPSNALARHYFARQLYVLMRLLMDANYVQPVPNESGLTPAQQRELTARRVAQWAVNTVDFRDPDSVMTLFEYDSDPFDGWDVDGIVGSPSTDDSQSDRRLVWGCEAPELLITETLAFHDRRVADTDWDSSGSKRTDDADSDGYPDDDDLDQPLIPQGSAFFEVYCPRNPNNRVAPTDLYTYQSGVGWSLDLGKMAPPTGSVAYPVWRMVISESRLASENNNVLGRLTTSTHPLYAPNTASLEPRQSNGGNSVTPRFSLMSLSGAEDAPEIDRIVWFTTQAPTTHDDSARIYYNRTRLNSGNQVTAIGSGEYLLVGPRFRTSIGGTTTLGEPSPHRIDLNPVSVTDNNSGATYTYPNTTTTIMPPVGMVVAADTPASAWNVANSIADLGSTVVSALRYGIGISISEPLPQSGYYPRPTVANPNNNNITEAYVDVSSGGNVQPELDNPFDSAGSAGGAGKGKGKGKGKGATNDAPLEVDNILATGTTTNYKTVFLQRLANPNMAYQNDSSLPNYNPYLTVDWSPIDLTVFNGSDRAPGTAMPNGEQWDPDDANPDATANYTEANRKDGVRFASRQRGPASFNANANLWAATSSDPPQTELQTISTVNFRHNLGTTPAGGIAGQTIGYVNQGYGVPWSTNAALTAPAAPSGYRGTPFDTSNNLPRPFPWLTWNDRPYASAMELLMVPSSHPARLCWEFSLADNSDPYSYNPATATAISFPFSHLLNFFHATGGTGAAEFYRVLDFVQVPSRFVGAETWLNPTYFGTSGPQFFRPPFNFVSNYRDPGKVNINTITSQAVWNAVMNGHAGPTFQQLVESRRGYGTGANIGLMDSAYPTVFANPFRSAGSSDLVPNVGAGDILRKTRPVNVSLLRAAGTSPDGNATPLFNQTDTTNDYRHTNRNPFFRYQGLQRLGNLVTTRSNVYAVWITVGYFEVGPDPATGLHTVNAAHPDGYWLGRELGADSGETKRHRAFYLIDRSIPVGFSRGRDYNVGNTILLSRFIE